MLGKELERLHILVCGLSVVIWKGQGHFKTTEGHTNVYCRAEKKRSCHMARAYVGR